jgi:hypothetical protein
MDLIIQFYSAYLPSSDDQEISASFKDRLSFYKDSSYYPIR